MIAPSYTEKFKRPYVRGQSTYFTVPFGQAGLNKYRVATYDWPVGHRPYDRRKLVVYCPIHDDDCVWTAKHLGVTDWWYCDDCDDWWCATQGLKREIGYTGIMEWVEPTLRYSSLKHAPIVEPAPRPSSKIYKLGLSILNRLKL